MFHFYQRSLVLASKRSWKLPSLSLESFGVKMGCQFSRFGVFKSPRLKFGMKSLGFDGNALRQFSSTKKKEQQEAASCYPRFQSEFSYDFSIKKPTERLPTYRVMNEEGVVLNKEHLPKDLTSETLLKMYRTMITLKWVFFSSQLKVANFYSISQYYGYDSLWCSKTRTNIILYDQLWRRRNACWKCCWFERWRYGKTQDLTNKKRNNNFQPW